MAKQTRRIRSIPVCNPDPVTVKFSFYIDPAGYIYDVATGERIAGANVWLQRPDGHGGWGNVPTGQACGDAA